MKALRLRLYKDKLFGHNESICGIYSPQGEKGGILVTVSKDGCLRGWDVFERRKISKLYLKREEPEEKEDSVSSKETEAFDPLNVVECCIFNQKTAFCGYSDGSIYAWNMKTGEIVYRYQGHEDKVTGIQWIDFNSFATCSYD
jgi:WD40 repeat protein